MEMLPHIGFAHFPPHLNGMVGGNAVDGIRGDETESVTRNSLRGVPLPSNPTYATYDNQENDPFKKSLHEVKFFFSKLERNVTSSKAAL